MTFPLIKKLWSWPDGWLWKLTADWTLKNRRAKYLLFLRLMKPVPESKILDVGVASHFYRGSNFLELWYPHQKNITAVGNDRSEAYEGFRKAFPGVKFVYGDGRALDFGDEVFDVVFSNAVVEHVGDDEDQKRFVHELCRVGKKIYIATPNLWFPVDFHTLIPFVHWFPCGMKKSIYRLLGMGKWSDFRVLNLLSFSRFRSLFPKGIPARFYRLRFLKEGGNMIAVVDKTERRPASPHILE